MSLRAWTRLLWFGTALAVLAVLLKFFVADVYRVETGSMRPTIFGGRGRPDGEEEAERVLVRYERDCRPGRFDLVVLRSRDGGAPLVKRVVGLPGEGIALRDGDLWVDGALLPAETPRPAPVPVFDDRWQESASSFEFRPDGSVRREGGEWVVDGGPVAPGSLLLYHHVLRDDYLDPRHRRVIGVREVNDAQLELEFLVVGAPAGQCVRFRLVEAGDTFEVELRAAPGAGSLRLLRRTPSSLQRGRDPETGAIPPRDLVLAETPVALESERWYRLLFSNVDDWLTVRCAELGIEVAQGYSGNEPWPAPLPPGRRSLAARVGFGAENGTVRFRSVRILRDLYYTDAGSYGVETPIHLGPDEYFLLGDNSSASTDSRHFGPVSASELIGRPLAVVWPRLRWLKVSVPPGVEGAEEGR